MTFPENLDRLVHYTTVRCGNVTEHIYRDGEMHRYFVMEKGAAWGADYDGRRRTRDWQFQWFWPDQSINTSENTARCPSCHRSQEDSDYLYTGYRIPRFSGSPVE